MSRFFAPRGAKSNSDMVVISASRSITGVGLGSRHRLIELLLRIKLMSAFSSIRRLPPKVVLDAVIGVLGVLLNFLAEGGEFLPELICCSCNAAILAAVGLLRGWRVIGGSRMG